MTDRAQWSRLLAEAADNRVAQPGRICQLCVDMLSVTGAGVSMVTSSGVRDVISATDDLSARIEELQVTLGEGPCVDAALTGAPVLVSDIEAPHDIVVERWPAFLPAVAQSGVRAIFALPLRIGAIGLGAIDLYRTEPGPLSDDQLAGALLAADAAAIALLDLAVDEDAGLPDPLAGLSPYHPQVHQATGMVQVQLGVSTEDAFLMLRARAFTTGRPLVDIAVDVVERRLRFSVEDE